MHECCKYTCIIYNIYIITGTYEGRSVQLRVTAFDDCDTSLLWTYSQVGQKCRFHSQRNTPHASRLRYTARRTQAYVRVYTALALARGDSKLRSDVAGKGKRDRKAPKAASHDATSDCKKI